MSARGWQCVVDVVPSHGRHDSHQVCSFNQVSASCTQNTNNAELECRIRKATLSTRTRPVYYYASILRVTSINILLSRGFEVRRTAKCQRFFHAMRFCHVYNKTLMLDKKYRWRLRDLVIHKRTALYSKM